MSATGRYYDEYIRRMVQSVAVKLAVEHLVWLD
jgi:hypothetical protein